MCCKCSCEGGYTSEGAEKNYSGISEVCCLRSQEQWRGSLKAKMKLLLGWNYPPQLAQLGIYDWIILLLLITELVRFVYIALFWFTLFMVVQK